MKRYTVVDNRTGRTVKYTEAQWSAAFGAMLLIGLGCGYFGGKWMCIWMITWQAGTVLYYNLRDRRRHKNPLGA